MWVANKPNTMASSAKKGRGGRGQERFDTGRKGKDIKRNGIKTSKKSKSPGNGGSVLKMQTHNALGTT